MLYQNFALFPMNEIVRSVMEGWLGAGEADCVLTYGYIDHEEGFMLEILAAGNRAGNTIHYYDTRFDARATLRIRQVEQEEHLYARDCSSVAGAQVLVFDSRRIRRPSECGDAEWIPRMD